MSGSTVAKCKKCDCVYTWSLDSFPFTDAEIVGTCDNCFNKIKHKCENELTVEYVEQ
jgi:hypothetical protein